MGGFGRLYNVDVAKEGFDAIVPSMLGTLPAIIIGVVIVLVLSASMSTLSSLVLTSASTITLDFIDPLYKKEKMSEGKKLITLRAFIVVFIAVSALIAIKQATSKSLFIAQMMGVSWGALAGAFLAPFMYGLYSKKVSKASVVTSFIWGVGLEIIQLLISLGIMNVSSSPLLGFVFKNSIYSGVIAMVGGMVIVPLVSRISKVSRPKHVDYMFACYDDKKTVGVTDNLGK